MTLDVCVFFSQLYVDKVRLDEAQPGGFDLLKSSIDVGDIVGSSGGIKRTERGELSVVSTSLQVKKGLGPISQTEGCSSEV